jgi:Histidine kinase/7TMR-DISM extracellular 2
MRTMSSLILSKGTKVILILFGIISNVYSQTDSSLLIYNLQTDTIDWQALPHEYWQILEDKSKNLTIDQVSSLPFQRQFKDSAVFVDSKVNSYWLRFHVKNVMDRDARIAINTYWDFIDTYISRNGNNWLHFTGGFNQKWNKKDGLKFGNIIPQIVKPGEELLVYQRLFKNQPGLYPEYGVVIICTEKYIDENYVKLVESRKIIFNLNDIRFTFYSGLLLIVALFNLYFFKISKINSFLYFGLFTLFHSINNLTVTLSNYLFWYAAGFKNLASVLTILWIPAQFYLFQFVRCFFEVKTTYPRWDVFLWTLSIVLIPIQLLRSYFYVSQTVNALSNIIMIPGYNYMAVYIPLLITLLLFIRRSNNNKYFKVIIIGSLPYFLVNSLSNLYNFIIHIRSVFKFNQLAGSIFFQPMEILTMLWFALCFSYILMSLYNALKQQIAETEIIALKAQMNPHFMFNCLNSIDSFIQTNDKYHASMYLNSFSRLLRNVLESSKSNTVPIAKDIETLKLYIELEELRHENKFKTEYTIDDSIYEEDMKVPPLIIQPFVENAIIHGLINKDTPTGLLRIVIEKVTKGIRYTISDNGIGRIASSKINQNYKSHYGTQLSYDRVKLFNKEETASVIIEDLYTNQQPAGTKVTVTLNTL